MSYFDPDIYSVENLKDEDKQRVDEIEYVKERVLSDTVVDEFIEQNYEKSGKTISKLLKETLTPFIEYLREQTDHYICDIIIGTIEDYTDEEFEALSKKAKCKEGVSTA